MTNPEFNTNPESNNPTEKLINRLKEILDEYGVYGSEIGADPSITRKAGFLADGYSAVLTIITEYVNPNDLDGDLVYYIDNKSKVTCPDLPYFITKQTDPNEADEIIDYVVSNITKEDCDRYNNPANADFIDWLLNKKDAEMKANPSINLSKEEQRRQERRNAALAKAAASRR